MRLKLTTLVSTALIFICAAASPAILPTKRDWFTTLSFNGDDGEDDDEDDEEDFDEFAPAPSIEQASVELTKLTEELKTYVHEEYIDYASFRERILPLEKKVEYYEFWNDVTKPWQIQATNVDTLFKSLQKNGEWRDSFKKCDYWGSDLVELIGDLYVRVLTTERNASMTQNSEGHQNIMHLDHRFAELKHRAKDKSAMSTDVKEFLEHEIVKIGDLLKEIKKETGYMKLPVDSQCLTNNVRNGLGADDYLYDSDDEDIRWG